MSCSARSLEHVSGDHNTNAKEAKREPMATAAERANEIDERARLFHAAVGSSVAADSEFDEEAESWLVAAEGGPTFRIHRDEWDDPDEYLELGWKKLWDRFYNEVSPAQCVQMIRQLNRTKDQAQRRARRLLIVRVLNMHAPGSGVAHALAESILRARLAPYFASEGTVPDGSSAKETGYLFRTHATLLEERGAFSDALHTYDRALLLRVVPDTKTTFETMRGRCERRRVAHERYLTKKGGSDAER